MHTYFGVTKLHTSLKCIKILYPIFHIYGAFHHIVHIRMSVILQC